MMPLKDWRESDLQESHMLGKDLAVRGTCSSNTEHPPVNYYDSIHFSFFVIEI